MSERRDQGSEAKKFLSLALLVPAVLLLAGFDDAEDSDERVPQQPTLREGPALYPEETESSIQNPETCTHEFYSFKRSFFSGYITKICVNCLTVLEKIYEA